MARERMMSVKANLRFSNSTRDTNADSSTAGHQIAEARERCAPKAVEEALRVARRTSGSRG
jgi:hypothetical protein